MHISKEYLGHVQSFIKNDKDDDWNTTLLTQIMGLRDEGFVYLMVNDHMPGLYKIGKSINPKERSNQLSRATGVPGKYRVIAKVETPSHSWVEKTIHSRLSGYRISGSEHFRIHPLQFITELKSSLDLGLSKYELSLEHPAIIFGTLLHSEIYFAEEDIDKFCEGVLNGDS